MKLFTFSTSSSISKYKTAEQLFIKIYEAATSPTRRKKILMMNNIEYYEFDNIYLYNDKKTNHQELIYYNMKPINTTSVNNIYMGKLKIWYHKSVADHKCLSETYPYVIVDVAVKIIEQSDAIDNENNEPEMLDSMKDTGDVVRQYGYHIDLLSNKCMIVLEWCAGGDLFAYVQRHYIEKKITITKANIKGIIKWLIQAVIKCHNRGICHSDLKLDNIMFINVDDIESLRIIDFGASKYTNDHGRDIIYNYICTSPHYTPPEVINKFHQKLNCKFLQNYKLSGDNLFKIDEWQIGVITYILLTARYPFDSPNENIHIRNKKIFNKIEECRPPKFIKLLDANNEELATDDAIDFVNGLMAFNPMERIGLDAALKHKWLN